MAENHRDVAEVTLKSLLRYWEALSRLEEQLHTTDLQEKIEQFAVGVDQVTPDTITRLLAFLSEEGK